MEMSKAQISNLSPFEWTRVRLDESTRGGGEDLVVRGVLQRAEAQNQNGRVYPKRILKREVERYKRERIAERRAFGELDHPDCFWSRTKMLTSSGWKRIRDVEAGEMCLTLNTETGRPEMQPVRRKISQEYEGVMYRIKSRYIDTKVTPNHRFWILPRKDSRDQLGKFVTAQELYENRAKYAKWRIPKIASAAWEGEGAERVVIPGVCVHQMDGVGLDPRFTEISPEPHDSAVHCVTVDNGVFYAMDGGKPFWTGNSSEVSLKNVSHVITRVEWRGNDVVGDVRVLPTPMGNILRTLFEKNLNVGISSRGLGSVRQRADGALVVGEDFELIAWDFVSNPSTHGAFMQTLNESSGRAARRAARRRRGWRSVERIAHDIIMDMSPEYYGG